MKITDYLIALKKCEDVLVSRPKQNNKAGMPKLTLEYGVYDNFPILYNAEGDLIAKALKESKKFEEIGNMGDKGLYIKHVPTGNPMQVYRPPVKRDLFMWGTTGGAMYASGLEVEPEILREAEKQVRNYNGLVVLHDLGVPLLTRARSMTHQIDDLVFILKDSLIPFCFSKSQGWAHEKDLSRLVYYKPKIQRREE